MQDSTTPYKTKEDWDIVIEPRPHLLYVDWKELWRYRDMIWILVRKEIKAAHIQTALGSLWYMGKAIILALTFALVFGRIARVNVGDVPHFLFFMSGLLLWEYFLNCLNKTGNVLRENKSIFEKVYVPRFAFPLAKMLAGLVPVFFELLVFVVAYVIYYFWKQPSFAPNYWLLALPFLVLLTGILGSSIGLAVSALTIRYRDLALLINYSTRLLMYASPIIYPLALVDTDLRKWLSLNPLAPIIETFRYAFFSTPYSATTGLLYAAIVAGVILLLSVFLFNRVEKNFVDTV